MSSQYAVFSAFMAFFRIFVVIMRRLLLYLFMVHFATGGMAGDALMRIPNLMEHYKAHRIENSTCSFWTFLGEHYNVFHQNHRDQRHAALPFHFHKCQQSDQGIQLPTPFYGSWQLAKSHKHLKTVFYFDFHLPVGFATTLLQPPQSC
jgi:hypothetical protein